MPGLKKLRRRFTRSDKTPMVLQVESEIESSISRQGRTVDGEPDNHIFPLPFELQAQILDELAEEDIFMLRRTCRSLFNVTQIHQTSLVRRFWRDRYRFGDPPCSCNPSPLMYCSRSVPAQPTFNDYCHLLRSDIVTHRLASTMTYSFVESKIFRLHIRDGNTRLQALRKNLVDRLCLALRHIQSFLIQYREKLELTVRHDPHLSEIDIQTEILSKFSTACLLDCYGVQQLLALALSMKFRPPSYAGRLERVCRGWTKEGAKKADLSKLLILGDFEALDGLLSLRPYAVRKENLDKFLVCLEQSTAHPRFKLAYDKWWERDALPGCLDSAITGSVLPTPSEETIELLSNILPVVDQVLIPSASTILLERRPQRCTDAIPSATRDFIYNAMMFAPTELDHEKIQEDWPRYYRVN